jgi:hypothetical protein
MVQAASNANRTEARNRHCGTRSRASAGLRVRRSIAPRNGSTHARRTRVGRGVGASGGSLRRSVRNL